MVKLKIMNLDAVKKLNIPKVPGSYQFKDKKGHIIYIGKAADLRARVFSYWRTGTDHSPAKFAMLKQVKEIVWVITDSEIEALLLESNLIKKHQPQFNVFMRDDKRYVYIKISTEEEWPRIFLARQLDQAGKYFGPFTSTEAVRETLRAVRAIWPYRSCRTLPKRVCLYYSIGKCPGVCDERISHGEYMKIVNQIVLFLEGKKDRIIKNYELRIKNLESSIQSPVSNKKIKKQSTKYPDAAGPRRGSGSIPDTKYKDIEKEINSLKYQLINLNKVLAHANIIGVADKYAADVVELAKILSLPKVPERIEGYDISNIFGKSAVGSMVVFSGGEPNKNEYRKFKIQMEHSEGNDVGMLREILERRFKHSALLNRTTKNVILSADRREGSHDKRAKSRDSSSTASGLRMTSLEFSDSLDNRSSDGWALPDLIIVDGGKGQLNAALSVLKKAKLDIPVLGVSKGEGLRSASAPDKIFFPGQKKPLELSLASPALHLIKRVRDEAHRFAIGYHKKLRKKALFLK